MQTLKCNYFVLFLVERKRVAVFQYSKLSFTDWTIPGNWSVLNCTMLARTN